MFTKFRERLRNELENPLESKHFGSGWISGVIALVSSLTALALSICILFPSLFTVPQLSGIYSNIPFRIILHILLLFSFVFAILNLILRGTKILGNLSIFLILLITISGQFETGFNPQTSVFFGLDWFVLNVLFTGMLFIPIERAFPKWSQQQLFRAEWREDLFYYFISSMMVQILSFLTLLPSQEIIRYTTWEQFRALVVSQPYIVQFLEIMFLTDFMQYWIHRLFHKIPMLWKFHAVHHSAKTLDWMAGARMHFIEILFLRGLTVIPMMVLGFSETVVHIYILTVYIYSTFIHANVRWSLKRASKILVTPRYHHWHHGIEKEAIDVNFAIHFPILDKWFKTYYLPAEKWPEGYGVQNHPVPSGYIPQFIYPFRP